MLQSPNFLFHVEAGPDGKSTRLRHRQPAVVPALEHDAGRRAVRRGRARASCGRPRAASAPRAACSRRSAGRQALDEFFDEWLRFDRVLNAVKDGAGIREFTPELARGDGRGDAHAAAPPGLERSQFMEALTADYSFLTAELATLYGVPAPAGEFEMVKFPAGVAARRAFSDRARSWRRRPGPTETSPTARGIFIREQLLCQHVPPPPPGVNTTLPDPIADQPPTRRRAAA